MGARRGDFAVAVVGESHFQRAIRSVCGPGEARFTCRAVLRLESDNSFDPNAVSVEINGLKVGYLDKSYAVLLRHELAVIDIDSFDCTDGHCDALILGGGPEKTFLGVWLDLPDFID